MVYGIVTVTFSRRYGFNVTLKLTNSPGLASSLSGIALTIEAVFLLEVKSTSTFTSKILEGLSIFVHKKYNACVNSPTVN